MQIVINIPDDKWKSYQPYKGLPYDNIMDNSVRYIANGTPLPKGHGDLIDREALYDQYMYSDYDFDKTVEDAPTIIPADKEVEDEGSD